MIRSMTERQSIVLTAVTSALILVSGYLAGDEAQEAAWRAVRVSAGVALGQVLGFRFRSREKERVNDARGNRRPGIGRGGCFGRSLG